MEKSFVENGFIIDLSNTSNTTQLVFELSSIMEHPDVKGKRICLKLGKQDLKQSQLLSIKALVESMDAEIAFIETASEQTEASAVSLGIVLSGNVDEKDIQVYTASEDKVEEQSVKVKEESVDTEEKTVEVHANDNYVENVEPISTIEGIKDIYTEQSTEEISEVIPVEHFETDFETLAASEGLLTSEEVSKFAIVVGMLIFVSVLFIIEKYTRKKRLSM